MVTGQKVPDRCVVVFDEAYYEFVEDPEYAHGLDYVRQGRNVIVMHTFSKVYGLAGVRIGFGIGDPELISLISRVKPPFDLSIVAENIAAEALADDEFYNRTVSETAAEKAYYYAELDKLGLSYFRSQTNYILIDVKMDCKKAAQALMEQGIIVRPAASYGFPTCIRITIGQHRENELFFKALGKLVV